MSGGDSIAMLLRMLDEAFVRKSWHGPNLRGSLRRVTAEQAVWRPHPHRHNIAEQTLHAAYWKYAVRRRLQGEKRGSFPLAGSNWFRVAGPLTESDWRGHVKLLEAQHRLLRGAFERLTPRRLPRPVAGGRTTVLSLVTGIIAHDLYHAGQIQLLKALYRSTKGGN